MAGRAVRGEENGGAAEMERKSPAVLLTPSQTLLQPSLRKLHAARQLGGTSQKSLDDATAVTVVYSSFEKTILDFNAMIDADMVEHVATTLPCCKQLLPVDPPVRRSIPSLGSRFFLHTTTARKHDDVPHGWNPFANSFCITRNA
ncbi:hypothetical protein H310_06957 [Aphanomyces invadans]|uniref:Uncharacterized protein n=1 Tax=Aphanomyces invadans TaxID=157072 RepID=A0A024U6F0_9STRA|nr:hypothetical protein H310_06957 [Aphanomyces invadans]ETW01442.1 hypothetical protein H310_06957 [Aphanomyces invadans]|eukprot:XP_008870440.1 hypothetical protein H310_06957 [Aphanomyces invadans]